jgi:hypothetical protein
MKHVHEPPRIGRKTGGSREQIEQSMVDGEGIDTGARDFAKDAHILADVGCDQH